MKKVAPYTLRELPYILAGNVKKIKAKDFKFEVYKKIDSGFQPALIYEMNKSVYVRLVKIGRDGFIKSDLVLRTYPLSSVAAYRLIVRL